MTDHKIGTREEWLAAPLELLEAEKELTRRATSWRTGGRGAAGGRSHEQKQVARH